ncbi:MAG: hypothetical protein ACREBQ_08800, partial [Nitrososphaerales archaeon]
SITQQITIPDSTPQFVNPVGSGRDASLILALLFVGANVVVIGLLAVLYRRKKMQWFSLLISLFLIFNVTDLYFSFLAGLSSYIPFVAAFLGLLITLYAAFKGMSWLVSVLALVVALELGGVFPVLLPSPLNWLIPLVYAVFDVYAVYYGRMGKLVKQVSKGEDSPEAKNGKLGKWPEFGLLSIRMRDVEIGMADIAFYTMVPGVALVLGGVLAFAVTVVAVDLGMILSFTVFRKSEVAPGLPIPILLGLGTLLILQLLV